MRREEPGCTCFGIRTDRPRLAGRSGASIRAAQPQSDQLLQANRGGTVSADTQAEEADVVGPEQAVITATVEATIRACRMRSERMVALREDSYAG